jgi:hypothetical protein
LKKSHEKQLQDLSDRIAVLKLGQEKTSHEMKGVKSELKIERSKFDKFLVRDREKIGYAQDMMKMRKMVMISFQQEVERLVYVQSEKNKNEYELNEALELGKSEMKRIDTMNSKVKKKGNSSIRNKKSTQKSSGPYDNVKSRLFKSIESSRKKEQIKYFNPDVVKRVEFNT